MTVSLDEVERINKIVAQHFSQHPGAYDFWGCDICFLLIIAQRHDAGYRSATEHRQDFGDQREGYSVLRSDTTEKVTGFKVIESVDGAASPKS